MTFANLSQGSQIFLDANILIYHASADPHYGAACKQLLERIARREMKVLPRLMRWAMSLTA